MVKQNIRKECTSMWKRIYKTILVRAIQKYNLYITNGETPEYLSIQEKNNSKENGK